MWADSRIQKENFAGKNAPVVVYSVGKKFMIKTITKEEAGNLLSLLPAYYKVSPTRPSRLSNLPLHLVYHREPQFPLVAVLWSSQTRQERQEDVLHGDRKHLQ